MSYFSECIQLQNKKAENRKKQVHLGDVTSHTQAGAKISDRNTPRILMSESIFSFDAAYELLFFLDQGKA